MTRRYRVKSNIHYDGNGDTFQLNGLEVWDNVPLEINTGLVDKDGHALVYTIEPNPIGFFAFEEVEYDE